MKQIIFFSFLAAGKAVAESVFDWYDPMVDVGPIYCVNAEETWMNCEEFGERVSNELADRIMEQCKEASCAGDSQAHAMTVTVEAIYSPGVKEELSQMIPSVMHAIRKVNPDGHPAGIEYSTLAHLQFPSHFIITRNSEDNIQGFIDVTIGANSGPSACEGLTQIGAIGSVIPKAGDFFGPVSIIPC